MNSPRYLLANLPTEGRYQTITSDELMERLFRKYDKNQSLTLSMVEFGQILQKLATLIGSCIPNR